MSARIWCTVFGLKPPTCLPVRQRTLAGRTRELNSRTTRIRTGALTLTVAYGCPRISTGVLGAAGWRWRKGAGSDSDSPLPTEETGHGTRPALACAATTSVLASEPVPRRSPAGVRKATAISKPDSRVDGPWRRRRTGSGPKAGAVGREEESRLRGLSPALHRAYRNGLTI